MGGIARRSLCPEMTNSLSGMVHKISKVGSLVSIPRTPLKINNLQETTAGGSRFFFLFFSN